MRLSLLYLFFITTLCNVSYASHNLEDVLHEVPKFQATVQGLKLDDGKKIMDVHVFNRIMKPHAAFFNRANSCLFNKAVYDSKTVLDEMLGLRALHPTLALPDISVEVAQLRGYLIKLNHDNETGMQISSMLSALWNYLRGPIHDDRRHEFITLLYAKMLENTKQKGGCFPGYAGRLMQVNQFCILSQYTFIMQERELALMTSGRHDPLDSDVEVAMLLSMQNVENNNNATQEELELAKVLDLSQQDSHDEDLQRALRLSREHQMNEDTLLAAFLNEEAQVELDRQLALRLSEN